MCIIKLCTRTYVAGEGRLFYLFFSTALKLYYIHPELIYVPLRRKQFGTATDEITTTRDV